MDTTLNYDLPYFGQININELSDYQQTIINLEGENLRIDLNLKNKTINQNDIGVVKIFLQNIIKFDKQNLIFIEKDFNEKEGETSDYIEFYLNELDDEELSNIIDIENIGVTRELQLLRKLKLVRIGIYPDREYGVGYFGVFDYSIYIDGEPCNQLLVVNVTEKGDLDHITWES